MSLLCSEPSSFSHLTPRKSQGPRQPVPALCSFSHLPLLCPRLLPPLPLVLSVPGAQASLLFLEHARYHPTSVPLHLLFPLLSSRSPDIHMSPFLTSFWSLLRCRFSVRPFLQPYLQSHIYPLQIFHPISQFNIIYLIIYSVYGLSFPRKASAL